MAGSSSAAKAAVWRGRLERFEEAGVSVAAFCEAEGVSASSFFRWRRRIGELDGEEGRREASERAGRLFATVRVVEPAVLVAELAGGTRLEVPAGDERLLRTAIRTIFRADGRRAQGGARC